MIIRLFGGLAAAALGMAMLAHQPACAEPPSGSLQSKYDAKASPASDLQTAIAAASKSRQKILLVVGGDWCADCVILDRVFADNPDIREAFGKAFVMTKIYLGPGNLNPDFLGAYPEIEWVPQFFVLDSDGTFLKAKDTRDLSKDHVFNRSKMLDFAREWTKPG